MTLKKVLILIGFFLIVLFTIFIFDTNNSENMTLTKEDAIEIAYNAVKNKLVEIRENESPEVVENQGNLTTNIEERDVHKISTELMTYKNILCWRVEISNVAINRIWGPMGFFVYLDAQKGDIVFVNHTK